MSARTYFYAGYSDSTSTGFHHRSDALGACIKHVDADTVKHGDRNRFVVQVDACAYAPDRANDKRGTLARFLAVNSLVCVHGVMPATVVARIAAERAAAAGTFDTADETRDARVAAAEIANAATAFLAPYGGILVDMLATVANRDHLRPVSSGAGNVRLAMATYAAAIDDHNDVVDVAGTASLASIGADVDDDADLTADEKRADRIARRRYRLAAAGAIDVGSILADPHAVDGDHIMADGTHCITCEP